ncbi:uncharacterized protein LOC135399327 isoform X2 [Ornithodoros turicata]
MRLLILSVLATVAVATSSTRRKREAYALPDGAELLIGSVRTSFQCQSNGYYADVDNNCQIFHVCNVVTHADGSTEMQQYSFMCGNQTIFNQLTFTCSFEDEAVPCQNAADFFYLNGNLGDEKSLFLNDNDIERAVPLIAVYGGRAASATSRKEVLVQVPPHRAVATDESAVHLEEVQDAAAEAQAASSHTETHAEAPDDAGSTGVKKETLDASNSK